MYKYWDMCIYWYPNYFCDTDGTDCLLGHRCGVSHRSSLKMSVCIVTEGLMKSTVLETLPDLK